MLTQLEKRERDEAEAFVPQLLQSIMDSTTLRQAKDWAITLAIELNRTTYCPACGGKGYIQVWRHETYIDSYHDRRCRRCKGAGRILKTTEKVTG